MEQDSRLGQPILQVPKKTSPFKLLLGLGAAFIAVFLVVAGVVYLLRGGSSSGRDSGHGGLFSDGAVGVIELNGVIMDSKKTLSRLRHFEEEDHIKAVVLRLDSPGGSVAPSQEIYEAVKAFKKPLVVSMGSVAASGAFYVACAAKKVYANPGTITGSIGVIMEFANLEKLYDWAKIHRFSIKTGKFKDTGAEYREMQPEERALLQSMIDNVLGQFKRAVASGRKLSLEAVTAIADGRVMSGEQAKAIKLVDQLGTLQDAIEDAGKQAGLKEHPDVVYPEAHRKWLEMLMDNGGEDQDSRARVPGVGLLVPRLASAILSALAGRSNENTYDGDSAGFANPGVYWIWNGPR